MPDPQDDVRIDKWLWAARFFSARNLARQAVESGRVLVGGQRVKPARTLRVGDELRVRIGDDERVVRVLAISDRRGPAPVARTLYEESAESIGRRERRRQQRREFAEPAESIEGGRPTKRDRRRLRAWENGG
jgi:ribosome-associated heat shock protein Hsp15